MTVYKAIVPEAQQAADLACDLATGKSVPSSMTNGKTTNNKAADIPSILLTPVAVNKTNIKDTVVKDNFWSVTDICTADFAAACKAAGLQ
jgi:D-xylose transport system substrate-binding protein